MMCTWSQAKFLIFSGNSIPLIDYSHITSIVVFLGLIILTFVDLKDWPKRSFRLMASAYIIWLFCDLVLWANDKIPHIMFFWTIANLIEPLIFISAFVFFYSFVNKKPITLTQKWLIFAIVAPTIIMAPIGLSTVGFDYTNCDRNVIEGIAAYYNYFIEGLFLVLILIKTTTTLFSKKYIGQKVKFGLTSFGISFLLISFLCVNFLGTFLDEYFISQYGHISVPIFAGFLAYVMIRYQTSRPRILLTDILVVSISILILSLFFVRGSVNQLYIIGITFIMCLPMAFNLSRGIRKEVEQKEKLEQLRLRLEESNLGLANANDKLKSLDKLKSEFLSLAAHQLRSPLTAIKGYSSMLDEGSYGPLQPEQDEAVRRIYTSSQALISIVEDLLNVSKIEQGGMVYSFAPVELGNIVNMVCHEMEIPAKNKNIDFRLVMSTTDKYMVVADATKIRQVILNLVDNAIKYTPQGFVEVSLKKDGDKVVFAVKDSGVGVSPETKEKLFQKFSRGEGGKLNTGGSGLGLYLAKEISKAHKGDVIIDSEGLGKGSTFSLVLPMAGSQTKDFNVAT